MQLIDTSSMKSINDAKIQITAVYAYFTSTLLGRQYLDPNKDIPGRGHSTLDCVIPVYLILQFIFYVGWLKVAEALMNPYGEDDDDFDMNWLVDRHLQVCYMMIDDVGQFPPRPVKDRHWEKGIFDELPHTVASYPFRGVVPPTSSRDVAVTLAGQKIVPPSLIMESYSNNEKVVS